MSDEERKPIEEVLPGFSIHPMPDKWTPIEVFVLVKCMDDDGDSAWNFRTSNPLNLEELLGVLTVHAEIIKDKLVAEWEEDLTAPPPVPPSRRSGAGVSGQWTSAATITPTPTRPMAMGVKRR